MIRSGLASLVVLSSDTPPAIVTELLGVEPTQSELRGSITRSGHARQLNVWSYDTGRLDNTEDDQTGTRAVRELLSACRPAFGRIASLPADCDAHITWSANSDSWQGGFLLPADLAVEIAALGVDVLGTVYFDDEDEDEDESA
ncbi:hypothetical protein ASD93_08440 [Microbacterium sp. Root180]|nr:hypothetical protein ASD93_08440 [Microbacterium sp. Root180]